LPLPELYRRVERHIPPFEWPILADDIAAILKLKEERHAVILAEVALASDEVTHAVSPSLDGTVAGLSPPVAIDGPCSAKALSGKGVSD
jgi:quinolinate synthase